MNSSMVSMILLQIFLILLNAVFACAEIAVITMNDRKLERMAADGDKRAIRLAKLTSQPARFLATIQVAITLSGFMGSAFASENFSDGLVSLLLRWGVDVPEETLRAVSVVFITVVLSYFTLVFGELVPKRIAMRKAEPLALAISGLISAISTVCAPIVWFLTLSTNTILRLVGIDPQAEEEEVSEEEIRMMVDVGSEKGTIDHTEKEFIQNVFEFDDLTAGDIATHRTDLSMLWLEDDMDQWKDVIYNSWHTRYPICDGSADNVVGVLNAKEYFRLENQSRENVMANAVKPAYFVPESVKADVLFRNMKHTRNNVAVVLDEYGGLTGIVTLNDLVEQLVGDLDVEESDAQDAPSIQKISENSWRICGDTLLEDVSEALGVTLPQEDYDTLTGLIFDALGSIPQDGTTTEIETAGLSIQVTEISDHQVVSAVVTLLQPAAAEENP